MAMKELIGSISICILCSISLYCQSVVRNPNTLKVDSMEHIYYDGYATGSFYLIRGEFRDRKVQFELISDNKTKLWSSVNKALNDIELVVKDCYNSDERMFGDFRWNNLLWDDLLTIRRMEFYWRDLDHGNYNLEVVITFYGDIGYALRYFTQHDDHELLSWVCP